MEFLGYGCTDGRSDVVNSFKNKISFRGDSSSSTVFLEGSNLQTEDTAVYYCACYCCGLLINGAGRKAYVGHREKGEKA